MSTGYKIHDQHAVFFLTCSIVDWVDLFTRKSYRDIIIDSLCYCVRHKGLLIYGYVIMSNHIHLIVRTQPLFRLSATIRDFKKFTAFRMLNTIATEPESRRDWMMHRFRYNVRLRNGKEQHQLWRQGQHAKEIYSEPFFRQKLNYIHQNPVRAGIVDLPEDYVYSSAHELSGRGNKIPVELWW